MDVYGEAITQRAGSVRSEDNPLGDLIAALPEPLLGDLGDHLIDPVMTDAHVEALLSAGTLIDICHGDLADALERAQLLYIQGQAITEKIKVQRAEVETLQNAGRSLAASCLKTQPKARPKKYGDHAFVQAMWMIWTHHAPDVRGFVAYDGLNEREREGRFQRFVAGWLAKIDHERTTPPSRHVYQTIKRRLT